MHTADTTAAPASVYAPGEVLNRTMTAREFVAAYAADAANLFLDHDDACAEIEAAAHAEARRLALPVSPEGVYPVIVWDGAWHRLEDYGRAA